MTTTTAKTTSTAEKKDVQKLQRAIINGLEDVKAVDIQVFDTEHITSLFERVIVATGSSNRQTKALAASVRDSVRDAGFPKPRIEGEDNGEWIIVDCGAAVAHIMQPTIRQYYHLEEIWGDKPIRLKLGASAPKAKSIKPETKNEPVSAAKARPVKPAKAGLSAAGKPAAKKTSRTDSKSGATQASAKAAKPAMKPTGKTPIVKVSPAKKAVAKKTASKTAAKLPVNKKSSQPARKAASKPAAKTAARKTSTRGS